MPRTRRADSLRAFTAGINAYIESRLAPGGPARHSNFRLGRLQTVEPWKPDRLASTAWLRFSMTGNAFDELGYITPG